MDMDEFNNPTEYSVDQHYLNDNDSELPELMKILIEAGRCLMKEYGILISTSEIVRIASSATFCNKHYIWKHYIWKMDSIDIIHGPITISQLQNLVKPLPRIMKILLKHR